MKIETFTVDPFYLVDAQNLSAEQEAQVATALVGGLRHIPDAHQCEALGLKSDGDYPILRFGVFRVATDELAGGFWIGCNRKTGRSTARAIVIDSVPLTGATRGNDDFFDVKILIVIVQWLLSNDMVRDDGGTVRVKSFEAPRAVDAGERVKHPLLSDYITEAAKHGDILIELRTVGDLEFIKTSKR